MPKINVYLPDELADAVKESGVAVSAICQRALEQAVRRVTTIRRITLDDVDPETFKTRLPNVTDRMHTVLRLAIEHSAADASSNVTTAHLLAATVEEGQNLALRLLRAMDIQPETVTEALATRTGREPGGEQPRNFSNASANALELAVVEAVGLGHNYVGCEHLLLGLVAEPDGLAGETLRSLGADPKATRRTVHAALTGYAHLRAATAATGQAQEAAMLTEALKPIVARLDRLEERLGPS
jgi:ATP-dependent Clp protease ATP-binding subunit ClpA